MDFKIFQQFCLFVSQINMKWKEFFKSQLHIGFANTIPIIGIKMLELFTEDKIINSYDSLQKNSFFPPKWVKQVLDFLYKHKLHLLFITGIFDYSKYCAYIYWPRKL